MEININHESSIEFMDSDHLIHENRILRRVIREKDERILKLENDLEKFKKIQIITQRNYHAPYGA